MQHLCVSAEINSAVSPANPCRDIFIRRHVPAAHVVRGSKVPREVRELLAIALNSEPLLLRFPHFQGDGANIPTVPPASCPHARRQEGLMMTNKAADLSGEERLIARSFRPLAKHPGALGLVDDAAALMPQPQTIRVHQKSKSVWIGHGEYMGQIIEVL